MTSTEDSEDVQPDRLRGCLNKVMVALLIGYVALMLFLIAIGFIAGKRAGE